MFSGDLLARKWNGTIPLSERVYGNQVKLRKKCSICGAHFSLENKKDINCLTCEQTLKLEIKRHNLKLV